MSYYEIFFFVAPTLQVAGGLDKLKTGLEKARNSNLALFLGLALRFSIFDLVRNLLKGKKIFSQTFDS